MVYVPSHQHNFFVERIYKKRNCNFKIASKVGLLTFNMVEKSNLEIERKEKQKHPTSTKAANHTDKTFQSFALSAC